MAIDNKLKTAAQIRDENIKKMLDRLKEHVSVIGNILIFGCLFAEKNVSDFFKAKIMRSSIITKR